MKSTQNKIRPKLSILAVHGFTGDAFDFEPLFDHFDACWRFVNLPGHHHGFTEPIPIEGEWAQFKDRVTSVVDELNEKPDPVVVIAYSMGARLLVRTCLEEKLRLEHAILIGFNPGIRDERERAERLEHDSALAAKLRSEGIEKFIDKWMDQPIIRSQQGKGAEVRIARKKQLLAEPLAASLEYFSNGRLTPVDEEFSKIASEITLISGEQDHKFGAIHRALADQHANVVCLKVPESGHAPNIENPRLFSELLEELLN